MATSILVFAKAPVPGRVKTRLIPLLGAEGAAELAARMLGATVQEALAAKVGPVELCADPDPAAPEWRGHLPQSVALSGQGEGDLGVRLARAAARRLAARERVLLIGTDCPELDARRLRKAAAALDTHDAVLIPVEDGGYALLGLRRFDASLFDGIAWSTGEVASATLERIRALGWGVAVGETLRDIDEPSDLAYDPAA